MSQGNSMSPDDKTLVTPILKKLLDMYILQQQVAKSCNMTERENIATHF